ncbi:ABC transporter ATP-binding protein [Alsobacter sp. SYSU M60028]|uniref:ABC transporter ATP-binding protein n=1 Tax=Alsobacter ponti TaxID=2962936 RepID=A0ABT1LD70_9HYPH|nr:ABC transporter ATP-binding protein [Alsobacter ponti]MCP8939449.1 ABC transporter ATP-binding protein [Alsobacter ponti]
MSAPDAVPLLRVRDLAIEFGPPDAPLRVVDGVGFDLARGECIGIVGESGSGKSMTSLAMMRLIPEPPGRIAGGRVELEGRDLLSLPVDAMRDIRGREIAMVFQEPMSSLNPVMTIGAQIGETLLLHDPMSPARRRERVIEMLGLVGIPSPEDRLDAYPHEFSGGMRQRVMIAMALACNPKVLIADEPTTALDVTIQAQVLDLMKRLREQLHTAIVLISHDLGVISDIADRVIVMYCGRVVETANIADIFERPAHPYTEGLLRSIPSGSNSGRRLYQIPGTVPSPQDRGPGCDFYDRCPRRMPECLLAKPPLFDLGRGQAAACYAAAREAVS